MKKKEKTFACLNISKGNIHIVCTLTLCIQSNECFLSCSSNSSVATRFLSPRSFVSCVVNFLYVFLRCIVKMVCVCTRERERHASGYMCTKIYIQMYNHTWRLKRKCNEHGRMFRSEEKNQPTTIRIWLNRRQKQSSSTGKKITKTQENQISIRS